MIITSSIRRYLGFGILLAIAGFAASGYHSIRRDVENLRVISQDNILWTATQMEVELLRFQLSVAQVAISGTDEAIEAMRGRFDLLYSRVSMMRAGRVGGLIRQYDEGHGSIRRFLAYLEELDPLVQSLTPADISQLAAVLVELQTFQQDLRLYTLRVVRGDTAASAEVRNSIQRSAQITMTISLAAVLLSLIALALILAENRRQHEIAELNQRIAREAEQVSRGKSRFLTMMSHELRNPLNGLLGPLALLSQADLTARHRRLVDQAKQSGKAMTQMIGGLLDYGEIQDGRFTMRAEPFRPAMLVRDLDADLAATPGSRVEIVLDPGCPELLLGDMERLRHIFVHLTEYVLDGRGPNQITVRIGHTGEMLRGEILFDGGDAAIDWKLDLMMGLNEIAPDQLSTEALRPLIARGVIAAARGILTLAESPDGKRSIRVDIPAPSLRVERVRVRLETRSGALAAIYQAALRSDRITFVSETETDPVDMVLVDATSVGEMPLMTRLRERYPGALFVSLGPPQSPDSFDDVVESPSDMSRLRSQILSRLPA